MKVISACEVASQVELLRDCVGISLGLVEVIYRRELGVGKQEPRRPTS